MAGEDTGRAAESTRMQLNQYPAGEGPGGSGDLVARDDELGALGNMAHGLHGELSAAGGHAKQATADAAGELTGDGLDMGAALRELGEAWTTKMNTLKEACAHISNHLDYTRGAHAKDEAKIATDMRDVHGKMMSVSRIHDFIK